MPLSKRISKDNSKKTFWILFGIRVAILLFFDFFVTTNIAIVDFAAVFVGAFILAFLPNGTNKVENGELNNEETIARENNVETVNDGSPIVSVDPAYLVNEKKLLKNMVKEEIENQGENAKGLTTAKINKKRNITILIFGLLTFAYMLMYFFNVKLTTCLIYEATMEKKQVIFPIYLKTGLIVLVAVFIPMIMFTKPKMIYFKYGDGYSLVKYTKGLTGQQDAVVIPDTYKGKNVVAIGESAFRNSNVKNVTLPQNLESIKSKAFYDCKNLEKVYIPQKVTEIREGAFENCSKLRTVSLPDGLIDIRASAFKNDKKLSEIELPESLEYLGASAFAYCNLLKEITIPSKVVELNGQTFEYCTSLRRIYLHDNIISIHGENFVGDINLDNVVLPSKITEIRGNTFEGCSSLSSIVIPEGVTRIGGHAFYGCRKLSYVDIPSTVVEIGSSAFRQCYSLRTIQIPRNASVNERAFKESPTAVTYY